MPPAPTISDCVRRHRSDWIAQIIWAIQNNTETPAPLANTNQKYAPKSDGRIDPLTGLLDPDNAGFGGYRGPQAYDLFIPPEPRIGYAHGENHLITTPQVRLLMETLENRGLRDPWDEYVEGGCFAIFSYWPSQKRVMATSKSYDIPNLDDAALLMGDCVPIIGIQALELQPELVPA